MQESDYSMGKFLTLNRFVAEIAEMRDQLIDLGRIKAELGKRGGPAAAGRGRAARLQCFP